MPPFEHTADQLGKAANLVELRYILGDCHRCNLYRQRRHIVYGGGNPNADVLFVGEAPGENEDRKGEPFVGNAGELLTTIIEEELGLRREDVYITNLVKCRPPQNRDPTHDEVVKCRPFLVRQIELVGPRALVALGKFAAQTLLGSDDRISMLRGKWRNYNGIRLMPTFHPAYVLRCPTKYERLFREDIKRVLAVVLG